MSSARFIRSAVYGLIGLGGVGTSVVLINDTLNKHTVNASYTTHHNTPEPTYKWDDNWDL